MKLALVLLFGLVSVSYQQFMPRMMPSAGRSNYYNPRNLLLNYIYANQYAEEDQYESMVFDYFIHLWLLKKI